MIRPAHKEEHPALVAIWEEAVANTHHFLNPDDFREIKNRMPDHLAALELYVWEEDGRNGRPGGGGQGPGNGSEDGGNGKHDGGPAGFVALAGDRVEMLFVADRGRGIGRKLLDFAVARGAVRLDVNEQNAQARMFYEKYGFRVVSRSEFDADGRPYPLLHMELSGLKL